MASKAQTPMAQPNTPPSTDVTVAISALTSGLQVQYGVLMAATLISVVPVVVSYLLFQKAFVAGVLGGSSK